MHGFVDIGLDFWTFNTATDSTAATCCVLVFFKKTEACNRPSKYKKQQQQYKQAERKKRSIILFFRFSAPILRPYLLSFSDLKNWSLLNEVKQLALLHSLSEHLS